MLTTRRTSSRRTEAMHAVARSSPHISLRSSGFLSFSRQRDRVSKRASERARLGWGEVGRGCEKRNRLQSIPNIYRTPFAHEQGAIVQFDWLIARQSRSDIRNLTSIARYVLKCLSIGFRGKKIREHVLCTSIVQPGWLIQ